MSQITSANTLSIGPYHEDWDFMPASIFIKPAEIIKKYVPTCPFHFTLPTSFILAHLLNRFNEEAPVEIHVSISGESNHVTTLSRGNISLSALRVTMPGVCRHLGELSESAREAIRHVILPPGSLEAYRSILNWIKLTITSGRIEPFPLVKTKMPILRYTRLIEAAQALKMEYLEEDLERRISDILRVEPGEELSLNTLDLAHVIVNKPTDDPLRTRMVAAIDRAKVVGKFSEEFKKEYKDLLEKCPNCGLSSLEDVS